MRVVVTGASGNVGTALLRLGADLGWRLVGVARRPPDERAEPYSAARWVSCDIGAGTAVRPLTEVFTGADAVVHLAWAVQPSTRDQDMDRANLAGSANVLEAAEAAGVPTVVALSSVAAYSPAGRWRRVDEDWPRGGLPGSAYSTGKALFEGLLDGFQSRNPSVRVARLRPCAVVQHAAGAQLDGWALSPLVPLRLLGRPWAPVPLSADLRLQVVHADDVAHAVRLVLQRGASGAFNLAAEPVLPADELAGILGGFRVPVPRALLNGVARASWRVGAQPLHPGWLELAAGAPLMSTARARAELGWRPTHDAVAALADVVRAMRSGAAAASPALRPAASGTAGRWRRLRPGRPTHQSQGPRAHGGDGRLATAGHRGESA